MSRQATRAGNAARKHARPSTPATPAENPDHALANIRAWTQLLVARGNRLLELAVREREELGREQGSMQFTVREPAAKAGDRAGRAGKPRASLQARPQPEASAAPRTRAYLPGSP